jgi:hypothetical protein
MVGLQDESYRIVIANARQVLCSMAHCPMRLEKDKTVRMNPFGTYYGKQRHHRGRAKDQVLDAYTLVAAQGKSIAPSYNGTSETAILGIYGFGESLTEEKLSEIRAFADGCVAVTSEDSAVAAYEGDNVKFREYKKDNNSEKDLKNPVMTGLMGNLGEYIYKGVRGIGNDSVAIFNFIGKQSFIRKRWRFRGWRLCDGRVGDFGLFRSRFVVTGS